MKKKKNNSQLSVDEKLKKSQKLKIIYLICILLSISMVALLAWIGIMPCQ